MGIRECGLKSECSIFSFAVLSLQVPCGVADILCFEFDCFSGSVCDRSWAALGGCCVRRRTRTP